MIAWLEHNPVGRVLAMITGGLVALMVAIGVIWSLPPGAATEEADDGGEPLQVEVPHLPESEPIESYAVVIERPVFNESRLPELESDAEEEDVEGAEEEEVEAPELELAGVVITPDLRMVTLREKKAKRSLVAFEGQPLQGDYGSWHVSRIAPREITLASGDGRELQLQLEVHDAKIAAPPKAKPESKPEAAAEPERAAAAEAEEEGRPLTRAEEIRQRIAQRREELRRAAEAEKSGETQLNDYQTAVRSMIGIKKKPDENDNER